MDKADQRAIGEAGEEARKLLSDMLEKLKAAQQGDKFFPNGIEKIDIEIGVGPAGKSLFQAKLLVEGPKAQALVAGAPDPGSNEDAR